MTRQFATVIALSAFCLAGCETTQDTYRFDGVTHGNGDSVAANSAMQIVDPWPRGSSETRLIVPAERAKTEQRAAVPSTTSE